MFNLKKIISLLLAIIVITGALAACGSKNEDSVTESSKAESTGTSEKSEIVVFAAASMTETLEEISGLYSKIDPSLTITYNFDSSGTLKTQIEEGSVCDLFISAAQKQMNGLDEGGYIDADTRVDLLENKVALCKAENSKKDINSYDDMKKHLESGDILMAIGNDDVPVGQYTQKIFKFYGLDEKALTDKGALTYGSNVKEVTTQISEGSVDCGIIYQTDAYSAGLKVTDTATEEMCGKVVYPAAVLKNSKQADKAKAFLDYLKTDEASKVFEKVGFTPLS